MIPFLIRQKDKATRKIWETVVIPSISNNFDVRCGTLFKFHSIVFPHFLHLTFLFFFPSAPKTKINSTGISSNVEIRGKKLIMSRHMCTHEKDTRNNILLRIILVSGREKIMYQSARVSFLTFSFFLLKIHLKKVENNSFSWQKVSESPEKSRWLCFFIHFFGLLSYVFLSIFSWLWFPYFCWNHTHIVS